MEPSQGKPASVTGQPGRQPVPEGGEGVSKPGGDTSNAFGYTIKPEKNAEKTIPGNNDELKSCSDKEPRTLREMAFQSPLAIVNYCKNGGRYLVEQGVGFVKNVAVGGANLGAAAMKRVMSPSMYVEGGKQLFDLAVDRIANFGGSVDDKLFSALGFKTSGADEEAARQALKELITYAIKFHGVDGEAKKIDIPSLEYIHSKPPILIKDICLTIKKTGVAGKKDIFRQFDIDSLCCDVYKVTERGNKEKICNYSAPSKECLS